MAPAALLENIRNLGLVAHVDAGKTTTTERILFQAGKIRHIGDVAAGSTVTDWMLQEQERGISITAAAVTFGWRGVQCNLIDTPGHVDFSVEVERCLRVLDGVVVIFCGVRGVEAQSETVWRQADHYAIPRIVFINKCDRTGADPAAVVAQIATRLGAKPLVLHWPLGVAEEFSGLVDLVNEQVLLVIDPDHEEFIAATPGGVAHRTRIVPLSELPLDVQDEAAMAREIMLEELADADNTFAEMYLTGKAVEPAFIRAAVRRLCLSRSRVPVILGAAKPNIGVAGLLDAVIEYLPSPNDRGAVEGHSPGENPKQPTQVRQARVDDPTSALAFKVVNTASSALTYLRVYSGVLRAGAQVLNSNKGQVEQIGKLVRMFSNEQEEVSQISAGDVGAAVGLKNTSTGDTLCDQSAPIILENIRFSEPVMRASIEANTEEEIPRLHAALAKLAAEDPSFRTEEDAQTSQTIIAGMGELHLEILADRLRREFALGIRVGAPQVAMRATIAKAAETERTWVQELAGRGQFAKLKLAACPRERGQGISVQESVPAKRQLPKDLRAAVLEALFEGIDRGVSDRGFSGCQLTDLEVALVDAEWHPIDSTPQVFKHLAFQALNELIGLAEPVLLEPIMALSVVCQPEQVGGVMGDLLSRRGKITGIETRLGVEAIACFVPLSSMFGYASDLRGKTQGRATYSMQFAHYAEMPVSVSESIVLKNKGAR